MNDMNRPLPPAAHEPLGHEPSESPRPPMKALLLLCCLSLAIPSVAAEGEAPLRDAAEIRVRGGTPNLLRKVRAADGSEIRVAYLGGSITAAPGWRVKSLEGLRKRFPGVKWAEIDAAIGGTGSDLGVFRVGQDVLAHEPDLLFVEFAVNDGGAPPVQIQRAMEGIVRQTRAADPETDIVFVYTVSEPFLADLKAGKCSRSATAMEEVADHYAIPSMHFGVEVRKRLDAGSLVFKGEAPAQGSAAEAPMIFSTDGVHPLVETGHVLYAEAVARGFDELSKAPAAAAAVPRAPGKPLRADHWGAAKLVPLHEGMLTGEWRKLDGGKHGDGIARRFAKFLPGMWRTSTPGAGLSLRFKGEVVGFFDVVGPDGGQLKVKIDGGEEKIVPRFDAYCVYHRLSKFQAAADLAKDRVHTVSVTLDSAGPDKRAVLFEKNRPDFDQNPGKFAPKVWTVGAVMLIGEVEP